MPEANYSVHTLLRARDWQHRPEFDRVCEWWRSGERGVCALVGMGGAEKMAIADRFLNDLLDDIEVALDTSIPANRETGQVELLAANHEKCGYTWGIVEGLHIRKEALLLRAAQTLGSESFDPAERRQLPSNASELINQVQACCKDAMRRWRDLRAPEPTEDNNFVHRETGDEYNHKAVVTYQVLKGLRSGISARYPLSPPPEPTPESEDSSVNTKPAKVFFSYAHEDGEYKDKLIKHLSMLKRQFVIETWNDREIAAGDEWKGQIDDNLESADVILLLVSADFLASDYCWDVEMKRALERHEAGEARVIPIILRSADWHGAPFAKLQALPKDAKAVKEWADEDAAFTDVARGIRAAIENPQ